MKKIIALALTLCLLLPAAACAGSKGASLSAENQSVAYDGGLASVAEAPAAAMPMEEFAVNTDAGAPSSTAVDPGQSMQKIVYNASLGVTADDPANALQAIVDKTVALGGYVAGSYTTNDDEGAQHCSATLKVPADSLDALVTAAKATGKVNDYQLSSDDISLQYYDIDARLNNAKAEEKQLVAILAECKTIEEILSVRESLTAVRGDIESYQAQINLWDNLVSFATLELSIHRTPKAVVSANDDLLAIWEASEVWQDMSRGFQNSLRFLVNAFYTIGIILAVAIIPAALLFLAIGLPILLHRKNKKKKLALQNAQPASGNTNANALAGSVQAGDAAHAPKSNNLDE